MKTDIGRTRELLKKALRFAQGDDILLTYQKMNETIVRFARGEVSTSFRTSSAVLNISVRAGRRYGGYSTTDFSDAGLKRAMRLALDNTQSLPDSDAIIPFPGNVEITETHLFHQSDESISQKWRLEAVDKILRVGRNAGTDASGLVKTSDGITAVLSSNGFDVAQPASAVYIRVRMMSRDGRKSGWNESWDYGVEAISPSDVAMKAVDRCFLGGEPQRYDPGRHDVILEPAAVASLLFPLMQQFNAEAIENKQSFLRKMDGSSFVGERLFKDFITVYSDPHNDSLPALPFSLDGLPVKRETWIKKGVINKVAVPRIFGLKQGKSPVATPTNIFMDGWTFDIQEIIAKTNKAILVSSFDGVRLSDPTNCLLTGMTRDGAWLVEDGKVVSAVKNFYFSETPVYVLEQVEALSFSERTSPRNSLFPMRVPGMKVPGFSFIAVTDIV